MMMPPLLRRINGVLATSSSRPSISTTTTTSRFKGYPKSHYRHWLPIQTRFEDMDVFAHVNNVKYYSFFDTVVNQFLISTGVLVLGAHDMTTPIGLCVSSGCDFFAPIEYPDVVQAGLFVSKISKSSVRYEVGIFGEDMEQCRAHGHFVHVYVDARSRRPVASLPNEMRSALETISNTH